MQDSFTNFISDLNEKKKFIDNNIVNHLKKINTFPPIIHEAIYYTVLNGGKRLRPIMVLEGAYISGIRRELVTPTACAIELIHTYSLVHDDLPAMDDDDYRRGKPTCHKVFGEANAILTGDALLTAAFGIIAENARCENINPLNVLRVISEISEAAGSCGMIGGQAIDLDSEGKNIDYEYLKTLHRLKTGELFKVSLRAGAILGGLEEKTLGSLDKYAYNFGLAFQITDDILDVLGDQDTIGKPIGSDDKNNKTTYVTLFGVDKAKIIAEEHIQECIKSLSNFGKEADFLRNLAKFTLNRTS